MADDAELQRKIAELSSRIHLQKQSARVNSQSSSPVNTHKRWTPYSNTHSNARGVHKPVFRHRTLVNNSANGAQTNGHKVEPERQVLAGVTTHDRGRMQWTSSRVFDKKAQEKKEAVEETARTKRLAKEQQHKNAVVTHVFGQQQAAPTAASTIVPREIVVDDLKFRVAVDGSKLFRVFGERCIDPEAAVCLSDTDGVTNNPHSTPKTTKIAGVTFVRTKNGNMIREGLLKDERRRPAENKTELCEDFTSTGTKSATSNYEVTSTWLRAASCIGPTGWRGGNLLTTLTGSCPRGNRCRYKHDINKLAICKEYFRHGACSNGEDCNLSHDPSPHRVPTCTHFLRGSCTKPDCRYAHVEVGATAPVCKHFARLGFCEKGERCAERHVSECPEYTNTGVCRDHKCRLPHVDRAGKLRKQAAIQAGNPDAESVSIDVSSDEEDFDEIGSDDVDSDDIDDDIVMGASSDNGHELSQQKDFISFS